MDEQSKGQGRLLKYAANVETAGGRDKWIGRTCGFINK